MKLEARVWKPMQASRRAQRVSHLMFADDIFLFSHATSDQVAVIKEGLRSFCVALGQRINFDKSSVYFSHNLPVKRTANLCASLGVQQCTEMGIYLGHRLIHHRNSRCGFYGLLQQVRQRLLGWKSKCLSRARRIMLAKTVLNTMAVYQMQL